MWYNFIMFIHIYPCACVQYTWHIQCTVHGYHVCYVYLLVFRDRLSQLESLWLLPFLNSFITVQERFLPRLGLVIILVFRYGKEIII